MDKIITAYTERGRIIEVDSWLLWLPQMLFYFTELEVSINNLLVWMWDNKIIYLLFPVNSNQLDRNILLYTLYNRFE